MNLCKPFTPLFLLFFFLSTLCDGSPLSDWFVKQLQKKATSSTPIPPQALSQHLDSPQHIKSAKKSVWNAYKKASLQLGWNTSFPPIPQSAENFIPVKKMALLGRKKMPYIIFVKGKKPALGWPMFICLHGGGANPNAQGPHSWSINTREWIAQLRLSTNLWKPEGIYLIPRMADDREGRWYLDYNQRFIDRIIQQAILFADADPNRIYLMGISEGGYAAYRLGSMMADRWAGSCSMAAAEPISNAPPENFRHVAFRCDIGEFDTRFNRIHLARSYFQTLDKLKKQHPKDYPHYFDVQKGRGHGINYQPGPEWIASFTRSPIPKTVTWTVIKQGTLRRYRQYWLTLDSYSGKLPLYLQAEVKPDNLIAISAHVKKENKLIPASHFKLRIYLNATLVDFNKEITVLINGKQRFKGKVKPSIKAIVRSTAERGDPYQVFLTQIVLDSSSFNE